MISVFGIGALVLLPALATAPELVLFGLMQPFTGLLLI